MKDSYQNVFKDKSRVLIVLAHPDDNEVICGGLVAKLSKDMKDVRIVVATNGEKGNMSQPITTKDLAELRLKEQIAAAAQLGVPESECFNLGIPDGELEATIENIGKIVWHIRQFKPDIIITHCPDEVINTFSSKQGVYWVNHRDHRHTGLITTDALYPYSRDTNFFPEQITEGLIGHSVTEILYADGYEHPHCVSFDVTDFIEQKRSALASCPSVIESDHVDGYIDEIRDGERYYEKLRYYKGLY